MKIDEKKPGGAASHRHPIGVVRREFIQVGFSGLLGFGLNGLLAARGSAASQAGDLQPRAKSVILVFLTGGLSHIDSLDMKPDAPQGIRGEFRPISTKTPGIHVCEHLPQLAARADLLAIVARIRNKGASIEIGGLGLTNGDDPVSMLWMNVLGSIAQFERELIGERAPESIRVVRHRRRDPVVGIACVFLLDDEPGFLQQAEMP